MSEEQVAEVSEAPEAVEVAQSDWRDSIPEEVRGHRSLEHINDIGALAKSYVHAQSMIGADKIALPGKSATDDDYRQIFQKLGLPETSEGYEITHNIPEGEQPDQGMVDWFASAAHQAGLTQRQAQALANQWNQKAIEGAQADRVDYEAYVGEVERELRSEYGQAYNAALNLGNDVIDQFGDAEFLELPLADGTLMGDNPQVIRLLANIGSYIAEKVGEDTIIGAKSTNAMTPAEVQDKLRELQAKDSPYFDGRHPQHDHYVTEVNKYMEMLYPDETLNG